MLPMNKKDYQYFNLLSVKEKIRLINEIKSDYPADHSEIEKIELDIKKLSEGSD